MKRVFFAIASLLAGSAQADQFDQPDKYGPDDGAVASQRHVHYPTAYPSGPADYPADRWHDPAARWDYPADRWDYPFDRWDYRRRVLAGQIFQDDLGGEIARLERMFEQGTPDATGRFGEVTARFGPQWSPYFWKQVEGKATLSGRVPRPDAPEAHNLLVEMAGRALRRHNALVADRLLSLYELRATRRLADQGVSPQELAAELRRSDARPAAGYAPEAPAAPAQSVVKVATFRDAEGYVIERDAGRQVLDTLTFQPDEPRNTILMLSLGATMQRMGDEPGAAAFGLEIELPGQEASGPNVLAGPTICLLAEDPAVARKEGASVCTDDAETPLGELRDQMGYTVHLVAPQGAFGGDVRVSHIVLRAYYVTGAFVEAGTIR